MSRARSWWRGSPDEYGAAALTHAVAEARLRGDGVVVVNATRGDALVDERFASDEEQAMLRAGLEEAGVPYEVRQPTGQRRGRPGARRGRRGGRGAGRARAAPPDARSAS